MKVLKDTQAVQTISIIPRSYPTSLTLTLRDDQTNDIDTYALNSGFSVVNDYLVIDNVYTLREFHFYDLTITDQDDVIIYKDRIFCTDQDIATFSVNADRTEYQNVNINWNSYNQLWDGTIYIQEPSNNDYIIL
jgi:hypothetical protein